MLQVLTNSSTCFGWSVICVSRSLQWMTFTPSAHGQVVELLASRISSAIFAAGFGLELLVGERRGADVEQALLGEVRDQAGIGAVLETAVGPLVFHFAIIRRMFMCRQ